MFLITKVISKRSVIALKGQNNRKRKKTKTRTKTEAKGKGKRSEGDPASKAFAEGEPRTVVLGHHHKQR